MSNEQAGKRSGTSRVFALVDCNNFFVSCERVFRPDLEGKPVVVLSSNDGCAVARSTEAKTLGIPMGAPAFKYRELFERERVVRFSANFELYGNISRRIVDLLAELTPRIEVYSIDESFLELNGLAIPSYDEWGRALHTRIQRDIGVPVSIGIASTKTLAKLAADIGKKHPEYKGSFDFAGLTKEEKQQWLLKTPIKDLWGIGWRLAPKLRAAGIGNALQLAQARPQYVQQLMGVHGKQMIAELNGICCLPLEKHDTTQKSIMRGRTFGEDTNQAHVIEAAIASLTSQAAFRMRRSNQGTHKAALLIETSRHKPGYRRWWQEVKFLVPVVDSGQIMAALHAEFSGIYSPRQQYHRANIFLLDLAPAHQLQTDVFGKVDLSSHKRSRSRMAAVDSINQRFGRGHIRYAAEDISADWRPKHRLSSPAYVSKWDELPIAKIEP